LGHLKRVERFLQGEELIILCRECGRSSHKTVKIGSEEEFLEIVGRLGVERVVIDSYRVGAAVERELKRRFPQIYLTVFDDTYLPHYSDEVVNPNPYGRAHRYRGKVPPGTKITLPSAQIARSKRVRRRRPRGKGIFLSLGATDPRGYLPAVVRLLEGREIHLYTTRENRRLKGLRRLCSLRRNCHLHIDESVAEGMAEAAFGIVTPSTLAWEALSAGLPFIALQVAPNQRFVSRFLSQKGIKVYRAHTIQKIPRSLIPREIGGLVLEK